MEVKDIRESIDKGCFISENSKVSSPVVDDKVKEVKYNSDGTVKYFVITEGEEVSHRVFREVLLNALRFNIAGETLTPYYYREYQKNVTPQTFATHLKVVEAQARVDQLKLPNILNKRQAIAVGAIVMILIFAIFGFLILSNSGMSFGF